MYPCHPSHPTFQHLAVPLVACPNRFENRADAYRIHLPQAGFLRLLLCAPCFTDDLLQIGQLLCGKLRDGFGIFNEEFGDSVKERAPVSAAEMSALREMNLSQPLTVESLRSRYKELCKLHHPDANGGDKQSEERFKRIGQAYKTLMESLL